MESRFSNQSEEQIRKEQENILKRFQQDKQLKMAEKKNVVENRPSNGELKFHEQWYSKNNDQSKFKSPVSHATIQVNTHVEGTQSYIQDVG